MKVNVTNVESVAELFCQYDNESSPQPVLLSLSIVEGTLSCAYNPNVGNTRTMDMHHGLVQAVGIPCLTAAAANELMAEVTDLAQAVLDGAEQEWNGNNFVGVYTPAARAAWEQIADRCDPELFPESQLVTGWDIREWFIDGDEDTARNLGITPATTDEQLAAIADRQIDEANSDTGNGFNILDRDEVIEYFTGIRDDLREDVRDQLGQTADQIAVLETKRTSLIRQIKGWAVQEDTLRAIGEWASLSHTEVGRVLRDPLATTGPEWTYEFVKSHGRTPVKTRDIVDAVIAQGLTTRRQTAGEWIGDLARGGRIVRAAPACWLADVHIEGHPTPVADTSPATTAAAENLQRTAADKA